MSVGHNLQWVAAGLLLLAAVLQLVNARRVDDPVKAKNASLSGWLFLFAGAVFAVLALDLF